MILILKPDDVNVGQRDLRAHELNAEHFRMNINQYGLHGVKYLIVTHLIQHPTMGYDVWSFSILSWMGLPNGFMSQTMQTYTIDKLDKVIRERLIWSK